MIAGNADVPSALSAKREKRWLLSISGITCIGPDADETSAFPALTGLRQSWIDSLAGQGVTVWNALDSRGSLGVR
jgi:hypothetical protein